MYWHAPSSSWISVYLSHRQPSTAQTSRYTVLPIDHDPPLARPRWHDFEKKYVGIKI